MQRQEEHTSGAVRDAISFSPYKLFKIVPLRLCFRRMEYASKLTNELINLENKQLYLQC